MNTKIISAVCGGLLLSSVTLANAQAIQSTSEYQAAMQAVAQNNYEQAYESLSPLTNNGTYQAAALVELGRIRQKQAEHEMSAALSHYNEAAEKMSTGLSLNGVQGSEIPKALYDLGRIYEEKLKNYIQAHEIYARIIDDYSSYMAIDKVYFNIATCEEAMGMYEEAAAHYQKVVSDYKYSTYYEAAQEKSRKLSPGTEVSEKAIESQEEFADDVAQTDKAIKANIDLGDMQASSGQYKQAAKSYRKAINEATDQDEAVEAYRKLVDVLDNQQKDHKLAASVIEEMLQKYPDAKGNEDMMFKLGQLYESDVDSMKKEIIDGKTRFKKNNATTQKALNYYDSVTEKYPDSEAAANAFQNKARIYQEQKNYEAARREYENFLSNFPQHNDAAEVKQKLQDLEGY